MALRSFISEEKYMEKAGSGEIAVLCIIRALKYHILVCSFCWCLSFLKWTVLPFSISFTN